MRKFQIDLEQEERFKPNSEKTRKQHKYQLKEQRELEKLRLFPLSQTGQAYAKVLKNFGQHHFAVESQNGKSILGVLRGTLRKQVRLEVDDLVLVQLRDYQSDRCDIIYQYNLKEVHILLEKKEILKRFYQQIRGITQPKDVNDKSDVVFYDSSDENENQNDQENESENDEEEVQTEQSEEIDKSMSFAEMSFSEPSKSNTSTFSIMEFQNLDSVISSFSKISVQNEDSLSEVHSEAISDFDFALI